MSRIELDKMADIIVPSVPVAPTSLVWLFMLLTGLSIALIIFYRLRADKQKFNRLVKRYQQKKINQRQIATVIEQLLKTKKIARENNEHWLIFYEQLQTARFSRHGLDKVEFEKLLRRVDQWV